MTNISQRTIEILTHARVGSPYQEKFSNPLLEEELSIIENKLKCQLPLHYREFLREFGRGSTHFYCDFTYETKGELETNLISLIYGFYRVKELSDYESSRDIIQVNLDFEPEKANEVLCIGDDPGGYQICLCVHGDNFGSVYFWDRGEAWEANGLEDLDLIATSFEEFVGKLRIAH